MQYVQETRTRGVYREAVALMDLLGGGLASLFSCLDFCPACPLRGCNSLASCRRNGSLFPTRFSPAQVGFPERCEGI
jgi:hypothetical protein